MDQEKSKNLMARQRDGGPGVTFPCKARARLGRVHCPAHVRRLTHVRQFAHDGPANGLDEAKGLWSAPGVPYLRFLHPA